MHDFSQARRQRKSRPAASRNGARLRISRPVRNGGYLRPEGMIFYRLEVFILKISTKGRYGLTIMIELAKKHGEGPTSLKSIAQTNDLSEHYLEQLVSPLRNAGLVKASAALTAAIFSAMSPLPSRPAILSAYWKGPSAPWKCLKMKSLQSASCGLRSATPSRKCLIPRRLKIWQAIRTAIKKLICFTFKIEV